MCVHWSLIAECKEIKCPTRIDTHTERFHFSRYAFSRCRVWSIFANKTNSNCNSSWKMGNEALTFTTIIDSLCAFPSSKMYTYVWLEVFCPQQFSYCHISWSTCTDFIRKIVSNLLKVIAFSPLPLASVAFDNSTMMTMRMIRWCELNSINTRGWAMV